MGAMELLNLPVKDVMTSNLVIVRQDTMLKDVKALFESENIHHILVVDHQDKFAGIISDSDLLLLLDWGTRFNLPSSTSKNAFLLTSNLAKDIMESNVVKLHPDDVLRKAVQLFRENYFRALPVVDENDNLKGIITTYDLMILAYTP